jgi:hypothetical protein
MTGVRIGIGNILYEGSVCAGAARSVSGWVKPRTGNYVIHTSLHMLYGNYIDVNKIGGKHRTHKRYRKCKRNFTWVILMLRDHLGYECY